MEHAAFIFFTVKSWIGNQPVREHRVNLINGTMKRQP